MSVTYDPEQKVLRYTACSKQSSLFPDIWEKVEGVASIDEARVILQKAFGPSYPEPSLYYASREAA
jgi:hypothetical protein